MSHSLHDVIPLNRSIYLCFIKGVILKFSRFRSHINYTASAKTGHFWFSFVGRCEFCDLHFEFENIKHALGSQFHGFLCPCSWSAEKSHICQPIRGERKGRGSFVHLQAPALSTVTTTRNKQNQRDRKLVRLPCHRGHAPCGGALAPHSLN